ncbi:MAG: RNA-binding domain-containing protein [Chitinophagaceae bacterium]
MALPININDLIHGKTVEWDRIEFKAGWNPEEVIQTICAFANDINNWGGGYMIIGVEEKQGLPILPPKGLQTTQMDSIQRELIQLTNQIDPFYSPVTEPVIFNNKQIFIIWAPGGDARPYKAPTTLSTKGQKQYFIRRGSTTVKANHAEVKQLLELAARIPFDDRINHHASLAQLDLGLIREFLQDIKSDLFQISASMPFEELCRKMRIVSGPDEYLKPVNAGLLFFTKQPDHFFRGAITEIIEFSDEAGTEFSEHKFTGPIHHQIRAVLNFLKNNVITEKIKKLKGKAEAHRFYNFPYEAVEEAVVNAYYHRSYEHLSTVEINVHQNKIEILSFPGPLPPVDNNTLKLNRVVSRDYRNRRIGEFLKELDLTEGRGTGIPKIRRELEKNGSPAPIFETDADRTSFLVILLIHPLFIKKQDRVDLIKTEIDILVLCYNKPVSKVEISKALNLSPQSGTLKRLLPQMISKGLLAYTIPDKLNSSAQKYQITIFGLSYLENL